MQGRRLPPILLLVGADDVDRLRERSDPLADLAASEQDAEPFVSSVDATFERSGLVLETFDDRPLHRIARRGGERHQQGMVLRWRRGSCVAQGDEARHVRTSEACAGLIRIPHRAQQRTQRVQTQRSRRTVGDPVERLARALVATRDGELQAAAPRATRPGVGRESLQRSRRGASVRS
jgi:hypothetical protein